MRRTSILVWLAGLVLSVSMSCMSASAAEDPLLDVNDISFLWPIPTNANDVNDLISLTSLAGTGEVLPGDVFTALITEAKTVSVNGQSISFPNGVGDQRGAWKVVGIRVNPSALGTNPQVLAQGGIVPGVRLIVQPVTMNGSVVTPHDITAHVVFNYITNAQPPFQPDKTAFKAIVKDLQEIKTFVQQAGVQTVGKLNVHPGLKQNIPGLNDRLKTLVKTHLNRQRLQVISFMGIPAPAPVPWIFFKVHVGSGNTLVRQAVSGHFAMPSPKSQGFVFNTPMQLVPAPAINAQAATQGFGISTSPLFAANVTTKLNNALLPGAAGIPAQWKVRDVADVVANPLIHTTANTDCVSCHTETTRRKIVPGLTSQMGIAFKLPAGTSDVDPSLLPKDVWNVRNFGWGLNFFSGSNNFQPTVTQRAANEAAESAGMINKDYLGGP